jgi:hypothetical protein
MIRRVRAGTSNCVIALLVTLVLPRSVNAQQCPDAPPGFQPRIQIWPYETLLHNQTLTMTVSRRFVHCTTSRTIPVLRPRDLRFEVVSGPAAGSVLAWREFPARGISVRLPGIGTYELRISSPTAPTLTPATMRVRVVDPATMLPVTLRIASDTAPRRAAQPGSLLLVSEGFTRSVYLHTGPGTSLEASLRLPRGTYTVQRIPWSSAPLPQALVVIDRPDVYPLTFVATAVAASEAPPRPPPNPTPTSPTETEFDSSARIARWTSASGVVRETRVARPGCVLARMVEVAHDDWYGVGGCDTPSGRSGFLVHGSATGVFDEFVQVPALHTLITTNHGGLVAVGDAGTVLVHDARGWTLHRTGSQPWNVAVASARGVFLIASDDPTQVYEFHDGTLDRLPPMGFPVASAAFRAADMGDSAAWGALTAPEAISSIRAIASDGTRVAVLALAPRRWDGFRHYQCAVLLWDGMHWLDLGRSLHEDNGDFATRRQAHSIAFRGSALVVDDEGVMTEVWSLERGARPLATPTSVRDSTP